ncbi:tRNA pseudouridine(38-40) synthase TruA [Actinomyces sp. B33]|uniref:tRNA pseudouridine(38-40) synthase TruA n=1 Tax=Actinomyces sp. B33 TaxID=2942131 RepID=UPI0023408665|nr:tRNA pseudouridine(38-40) synthase TruA [Actinomyces sp. B33]MDC4233595.1 tRNA pseudouridine(38-40) synthase TruA [Actinomyces sp. B33]
MSRLAPAPTPPAPEGPRGRAPERPPALPQEDGGETNDRIRLDLAYDGTHFHGWAAQPGLRTVQGQIEEALAVLVRAPVALTVAGRTDAGVHARHQVCHLDLPAGAWQRLAPRGADRPDEAGPALVRRLNGMLARDYARFLDERGLSAPRGTADIRIRSAQRVHPSFDARFSAVSRSYAYRISDDPTPLRRHDCLWTQTGLDLDAMNEAAAALLGEHDFLAYCRPRDGATTIRTLTRLDFAREGAGLITARVEADAFCHSMVRSLIGAHLLIGQARRPTRWARDLLDARTRERAAPIAPAHGLTLEAVAYPPAEQWAARSRQARRRRGSCCS